jgi:hypothetical protein
MFYLLPVPAKRAFQFFQVSRLMSVPLCAFVRPRHADGRRMPVLFPWCRLGRGCPRPESRAVGASAGRMPKRRCDAVSAGQDVRSERPATGLGGPDPRRTWPKSGAAERRAGNDATRHARLAGTLALQGTVRGPGTAALQGSAWDGLVRVLCVSPDRRRRGAGCRAGTRRWSCSAGPPAPTAGSRAPSGRLRPSARRPPRGGRRPP